MTHAETEQNDEEEWASEDSGENTISSSSAARAPSERKKRVRSGKGKTGSAGLNKKGRRRSSTSEQSRSFPPVRASSSDTPPPPPPVANEPERSPDVPEDVDRRGRSTHHARKSSSLSPRPSIVIQHRRLESLRLAQHSRDASPSRSIRFADEQWSGTSTPRSGMLQNEPWLSSNQVDDSPVDEDPESARGRVTFELPAKH